MKRLKLKSVLFALAFVILSGLISASATATGPVPLDKNYSAVYDTGDGDPGDTTDGGIRFPGTGH